MTDGFGGRRSRSRDPDNAAIHRDLGRAHRGIDAMRTFLWTCAVVGGLVLLLGSGPWRVAGALFGLTCVAGALRIRNNPYAWSVVFAVGTTAVMAFVVVVVFREAGVIPLEMGLGAIVMTLGSWYSVFTMRRAERLLREYPEHFAARRITRKERVKRR